jgi:hypothetical protein
MSLQGMLAAMITGGRFGGQVVHYETDSPVVRTNEKHWGGRIGVRNFEVGQRAAEGWSRENTGRASYNYGPVFDRAAEAGYGIPGCSCGCGGR